MEKVRTSFKSDGFKLDARFYIPENYDPKRPLVLAKSGFLGLNNIHPERFARFLTQRGFPCFGFDYRGFAKSEGKMSDVRPEEQAKDIAHAITFVKNHETYAPDKLVLLGWGMGAALVIQSVRIASEIDALVCVNGFYNNLRVQRKLRGEQGWKDFKKWYDREQIDYVLNGKENLYDPFEIYPLDPVTRKYVDEVLLQNPDFGGKVKFSFAESLLNLDVCCNDPVYQDIPLLICHGDQNQLHPVEEAHWLLDNYPGSQKGIYWIEGGGHTEWMLDDHPKCIAMMDKVGTWLETHV